MKRTLAAAGLMLVWMRAPESHASCLATPSQPAKLVVDKCTPVATSKLKSPARPKSYEGIVLEGMLTVGGPLPSGKDTSAQAKVWVPASEKLTCAQAKPKTTVSGTLDFACCDGDPNPPCFIETSSILTKVTIAAVAVPKPVKLATRTELETEVERLRAENAALRAEIDAIRAREKERTERLDKELGGPGTKLP